MILSAPFWCTTFPFANKLPTCAVSYLCTISACKKGLLPAGVGLPFTEPFRSFSFISLCVRSPVHSAGHFLTGWVVMHWVCFLLHYLLFSCCHLLLHFLVGILGSTALPFSAAAACLAERNRRCRSAAAPPALRKVRAAAPRCLLPLLLPRSFAFHRRFVLPFCRFCLLLPLPRCRGTDRVLPFCRCIPPPPHLHHLRTTTTDHLHLHHCTVPACLHLHICIYIYIYIICICIVSLVYIKITYILSLIT